MITPHQAKYYAHQLTRLVPAHDTAGNRLAGALYDASVDLNPHQIEAALFALRSPLSKGVILADEVGLGKTIEAGLVLAQCWAEHKRKLLIICPASLRRQWSMELREKFNLPNVIVDGSNYKNNLAEIYQNNLVIMSLHFAARLTHDLQRIDWDLVVIDEAHRLRNVYRQDNKTGKAIAAALLDRRKLLLTATPLQNSLLELFGLASLLDERLFGNIESFKEAYIVRSTPNLADLKARLAPFIKRTLRKDVLEYIRYTRREAMLQLFTPSAKEQQLYDEISEFILQPGSYAVPFAQRQLLVLVIRKLLASSSYAIIGTLKTIRNRLLELKHGPQDELKLPGELISGHDLPVEYLEDVPTPPKSKTKAIDHKQLAGEITALDGFIELARSIKEDAKAVSLLNALPLAFQRMRELEAPAKALIFTESSRTQRYLRDYLSANGFKDKLVTFNGRNDDEHSLAIYNAWRMNPRNAAHITGSFNVDVRLALVEYFKNQAQIMVATEAAAEGLNLQFCSLVVNYDLPWNPQRVEQRIGRCHRYGQKFDVVVLNFLNRNNHAEQRLYELLREKFKLFDGVFGASDEILGRLESGLDFEKRILQIFETCRQPEAIEQAFNDLQAELEEPIETRMAETRRLLLESFDQEVHTRLKNCLDDTASKMDAMSHMFWNLTKYGYAGRGLYFNDQELIFGHDEEFIRQGKRGPDDPRTPVYYYLDHSPPEPVDINATPASIRSKIRAERAKPGGRPHRLHGMEGNLLIAQAKEAATPPGNIVFHMDRQHIGLLEPYRGQSGWLKLDLLIVETFERNEYLIFTICDRQGNILPPEAGARLLTLAGQVDGDMPVCPYELAFTESRQQQVDALLAQAEQANHSYFEDELDKLDRWADDLKNGLELEIKALDKDIREQDRKSRAMNSLAEKLEFQKQKAALEKKRHQKRHELFKSQDEIDKKRATLINQIEKQLGQHRQELKQLFSISWELY